MSIDAEVERPKFEAWHREEFPEVTILIRMGNGYTSNFMNIRWQGWLAAKRDAEQEAKS